MKTKRQFLTAFAILLGSSLLLQSCSSKKGSAKGMVARMEVKEPIEGVCDNNNVLVLMSFMDAKQIEAKSPVSQEKVAEKIQATSVFLKNNPDFNGKGVVSCIINCNGELVQVSMSNASESTELDEEVMAVFREQKQWTPGTYYGTPVDNVQLISFEVENGVISI